jgi:hypothetical protein
MASSNSRRSSISNTDSGISCTTTTKTINPRYICEWVDTCRNPKHELDDCRVRKEELRGKLGIYYSENAAYKEFDYDGINGVSLKANPTGCTMIHLLIYKKENDEMYLLFATKSVMEKSKREPLLTFPSSYPYKKNEAKIDVAARALKTLTNENEIIKNIQSNLKRFIFIDANVIYPLYLTNEHAKLLTDHFVSNDEVSSIQWFRFSTVHKQLPPWDDYLDSRQAGNNGELLQIKPSNHIGTQLKEGDKELTLWSVTAMCLKCIRNHVGFEIFLQP